MPDASDRPLGDLASFLPLACDIEHDHVAVSSRLWIDANVRSPPVIIPNSEHHMGVPCPLLEPTR